MYNKLASINGYGCNLWLHSTKHWINDPLSYVQGQFHNHGYLWNKVRLAQAQVNCSDISFRNINKHRSNSSFHSIKNTKWAHGKLNTYFGWNKYNNDQDDTDNMKELTVCYGNINIHKRCDFCDLQQLIPSDKRINHSKWDFILSGVLTHEDESDRLNSYQQVVEHGHFET